MTARLPIPGQDDGTWGNILNGFLGVSLNVDGTIQTSALTSAGSEVTSSKGIANGYASLNSSGLVPTTELGAGNASSSNYLRGDGTWVAPTGSGGSATLAGDSDVSIISPANNQVLTFNSGTGTWRNVNPAVASVFGRTGAVTATSGDYIAAQVGALASTDDLSAIANANATAGNVSMNSHKLTNLTNGSASSDAAAFGQVPTSAATIGGLLATNNLSDVADAGSSKYNLREPLLPAAACVSTANQAALSGLLIIDGYTLVAGDDVLLVAQTTASQNGLWKVASGAWTRPTSYPTTGTPTAGAMAYVKNGTLGAGTVWVLITEAAVTIDTTATVWHKVSDRGFINVMDYGAVGDGVTNDAAAIQAAIAACPSGGMVWFPVPAAYYSVASTILLKAYVKFAGPIGLSQLPAIDYGGEVGPGGAMIRQANGANLDAVLASPGWYSNVSISPMDPGIQIENLGVDGNYLNQSSGMGYGIATCGWRNEVNHCWVINTRSHGIYHSDATKNGTATGHAANGFRAANNIFDVNQGDAFHSNSVSGLVTDGWFLNNEIQNPAGNGAYFGCIAGWTIDGNHPYGVGLDNIVGVGSNAAVISDNYLEFPGAAVTSGGSAHHLNLTVTGGGNSLVIHGNHMRLDSAPTAGVTYYGVYLAVTSGTLPVELAANGVDGYATGAYGTAYEINVSSGATVNVASAANKASSVATIWSAPGVGTVNTTNDDIMTAVVAAQVGTAGQGTSFAPPFLATSASAVLTSNHVYAAQIVVPPGPAAPITGICIGNGATATGNATMALFNSAGNQVAVSASTTITGTYTTQFIPFTGVYDAMPGVYSVAVIFSGSAAVFQVCSGGPSSIQAQGSYAMPSSITALSSAPRYVPGMSTY